MKYEIMQDFLPICKVSPRRRSGDKITKVRFLVAHDTGNLNSTAKGNVKYYKDTYNKESASAHLFVDDVDIIECIPVFKDTEKAWHVLYSVPLDNQLYGDDANDVAIGIEMCFFTDKERSQKAYEKYVWVLAYLCQYFNLDPKKDIIGHETLDPKNKIDPSNGLRYSGHTYQDLINDVVKELISMNQKHVDNGVEAVNWLVEHKIINSGGYWLEAIKIVKYLDELLVKVVNYMIDNIK
ncbi:MAG: N-acetylmuramoyl-L-alanine amidase [Clostridium butyricum]|jgi:N-acetylmuramoyl-L-alanine amidase CwlA|nr:N-acetylmuramoyl-L-alanine amidase [Clostridium butyricum]MDN5318007.1 N-acetylmuramoyl-L-alanine amidase [Thermoanaerobacterium sp.]